MTYWRTARATVGGNQPRGPHIGAETRANSYSLNPEGFAIDAEFAVKGALAIGFAGLVLLCVSVYLIVDAVFA